MGTIFLRLRSDARLAPNRCFAGQPAFAKLETKQAPVERSENPTPLFMTTLVTMFSGLLRLSFQIAEAEPSAERRGLTAN